MGFSRSARIVTLLVIDSLFFLLEIIVGYSVHSLALVADSFHMLNDVLSLVVALWAIRLAKRKGDNDYTYGWQRAEVLGALVNGVFLLALCLSIFLEAVQRFFEPQTMRNPFLVLGVGCAGLASNILGLFLFHDHGHAHGGHGHSHGDEESQHTHEARGEVSNSENLADEEGDIESVLPENFIKRAARSPSPAPRRIASRRGSGRRSDAGQTRRPHFASPVTDIYVHPAANRAEIQSFGASGASSASFSASDSAVSDTESAADERTPLTSGSGKASTASSKSRRQRSNSRNWHAEHHHNRPRNSGSGGGHSHGNLNMRGVFLHVLGDALGNVGVILTAVFVKYSPLNPFLSHFTDYADPFISLVITVIIFCSALPLVKTASGILLQGVPKGIAVDEVKEDIASIPGVESVHELHIWQLSDVKMIASLHIQIAFDPEEGGGGRYMRLARAVRTCLHAVGVHSTTIQPEYTKKEAVGRGYGSVSGGTEEGMSCLMDCGEECEGAKCCVIKGSGSDGVADGHGGADGHAH